MRKNCIILFIISSFFITSCKKDSNPAKDDPIVFTVSGKLENWTYGDGKYIDFSGFYVTSSSGPDPVSYVSLQRTNINAAGQFVFRDTPAPPDSIFLVSINNVKTYTNFGLFADSTYAFMHEYPVIDWQIFNNNLSFAWAYCSSDSLGYGGFSRIGSPVGTYSVIYDYLDRPFSEKRTFSNRQNGKLYTWVQNLNLNKGWNVIYISKGAETADSLRIDINQTQPAKPVRWFFNQTVSASNQNIKSFLGRNDLLGRQRN